MRHNTLPGRRFWLAAAALMFLGQHTPIRAAELPLWEVGLGIGAIAFQDYRGSDTTHAYPLPVPYVTYNGKYLKADRQGVRGLLFDQDWVELNISGNATTPVRNDRARSGMPDLRSTVELGPAFNVHLFRDADRRMRLDLRLPLRGAVTLEASPRFIGWTLSPNLALDIADPFGQTGWKLGLLAGPLAADRRYHDYFYTVAPRYALSGRPAYVARGGYAGATSVAALSKRFPKYWVGAYVRYDTLAGAAFENSPLVRQQGYWSAGLGISWILGTSSRTVEVPDAEQPW